MAFYIFSGEADCCFNRLLAIGLLLLVEVAREGGRRHFDHLLIK